MLADCDLAMPGGLLSVATITLLGADMNCYNNRL